MVDWVKRGGGEGGVILFRESMVCLGGGGVQFRQQGHEDEGTGRGRLVDFHFVWTLCVTNL